MAYMARAKTVAQEIDAHARLKTHIQSFRYIVVLDFDEGAVVKYRELSQSRPRIGRMDLKIAAIVLAQNATLLTRNLSDFRKVPGLKVEDWTLPNESLSIHHISRLGPFGGVRLFSLEPRLARPVVSVRFSSKNELTRSHSETSRS